MAIPWAAQHQDAEQFQELATESLPMAVIGLDHEQLAQKAKGPGVLR
jgi:hypothetical protein